MTNEELLATVSELADRAYRENKSEGVCSAMTRAKSQVERAVAEQNKSKLVRGLQAARKAQRQTTDEQFATDLDKKICPYFQFETLEELEKMRERPS